MNNAFQPVLKGIRALSPLAVALAVALSASVSEAQIVNLANGNSAAAVNLGNQAGMYSWTINNQPQLAQQWFWYRVDGDPTGQHSIDTIGPATFSANANTLNALYTSGNGFSINLSYTLNGGSAGSWNSDISESITINNLTGSSLVFHFFQYSDFALAGTSGGETATIFQNGGSFSQANVTKAASQLSETIDIPLANEAEADLASNTRNRLNSGSPYTLNNVLTSGPDPSRDATWAFEWDFTIAPNGSIDVLKDKQLNVAPVPEPATAVLLGLGLLAFALRRNRDSVK
jgi:hypothetical protein